jgi:nucleotide-binding universal stress UspA family protein
MLTEKERPDTPPSDRKPNERHILIAVDESENAKRALLYVADFLGGQAGIQVTILRIIPEPSEDYFETDFDRADWIQEQLAGAEEMLANYREILIQSGFSKRRVHTKISFMNGTSIAGSILELQKKLNCCTIVVGRRVVSRKEEFLFGSTSSALLHAPKSCAVWIVE